VIVCPLHFVTNEHRLRSVAAEMHWRGAPKLRGYVDRRLGVVLLSEGTHRINVAAELGLTPTIVPIPWWRSQQALINARFAAFVRGLLFTHVNVEETHR
jgi:hypothetical protein